MLSSELVEPLAGAVPLGAVHGVEPGHRRHAADFVNA